MEIVLLVCIKSCHFALMTYCKTPVDIFLVCEEGPGKKSFEIWVNNKDQGFSLAQSGPLPQGTQSVVFADMGM